jgi:hypothetical protein
MIWWVSLTVGVAGIAAICWRRHRRRRDREYEALAASWMPSLKAYPIGLMVDPDQISAARTDFESRRLTRVEDFVTPETLAILQNEATDNFPRLECSYIPMHKQGETLSYESIQRHAPLCLGVYHNREVQEHIGRIVGEAILPTPLQDQSSLSLLCYRSAGDHINWHFDHNFYGGRHFTVLLCLWNRGAREGRSNCRFEYMNSRREVETVEMPENSLVVFEGARIRHRATPLGPNELRVVLSMTYSTHPRTKWPREALRRVKDTAFFGLRALWD